MSNINIEYGKAVFDTWGLGFEVERNLAGLDDEYWTIYFGIIIWWVCITITPKQ